MYWALEGQVYPDIKLEKVRIMCMWYILPLNGHIVLWYVLCMWYILGSSLEGHKAMGILPYVPRVILQMCLHTLSALDMCRLCMGSSGL